MTCTGTRNLSGLAIELMSYGYTEKTRLTRTMSVSASLKTHSHSLLTKSRSAPVTASDNKHLPEIPTKHHVKNGETSLKHSIHNIQDKQVANETEYQEAACNTESPESHLLPEEVGSLIESLESSGRSYQEPQEGLTKLINR